MTERDAAPAISGRSIAGLRPARAAVSGGRFLAGRGVAPARRTAEILLESILGESRAALYTRDDPLSPAAAERFAAALRARAGGSPLQHLTGDQPFRRLRLAVGPGVFVPRPETEVVVELAVSAIDGADGPLVVDVGTGSGAIALAIKDERPSWRVVAIDVDAAAVALARRNAASLGLDVDVRRGDLLAPVGDVAGLVDLVVSNPPYVDPTEVADLPLDVLADPSSALVGDSGIYERLFRDAAAVLRRSGVIAVETSPARAGEVRAAMNRDFDDVRIFRDLTGRDRFVLGRRP